MPVIVNDRQVRQSIDRLSAHLGRTDIIMRRIGQHLRDYVRETIEMGGRGRPYAPLSRWTRMRTGRSRPLITLTNNFRFAYDSTTAIVFFTTPAGKSFSIWQHHFGFRVPARLGRPVMVIPTAGGSPIFTARAKESIIPARPVWPNKQEATAEVNAFIRDWINQGVRQWR